MHTVFHFFKRTRSGIPGSNRCYSAHMLLDCLLKRLSHRLQNSVMWELFSPNSNRWYWCNFCQPEGWYVMIWERLSSHLLASRICSLNSVFTLLLFSRQVGSDSFAAPGTVTHQAPLSTGISQVRILEWVVISFSRGSSRPRDGTSVSCILGRFLSAKPSLICWPSASAWHVLKSHAFRDLFPMFYYIALIYLFSHMSRP